MDRIITNLNYCREEIGIIMTRELAIKIWEDIFGDVMWAQDCFGTWIYKKDYGDTETIRIRPDGTGKKYNYGWEIDHINPKSKYADEKKADFNNNYEPMHYQNNRTKGDNTVFTVNEVEYKVVECDICKNHNLQGYGIANKKTGVRIDWKYKRNAYYG